MANPKGERGSKNEPQAVGVFGAASVVLRKVIANPLKGRNPERDEPGYGFNALTTDDPVNEILEGEIFPRLLMENAAGASLTAPGGAPEKAMNGSIDPADTDRFANLPLRLEAPSLIREVERFVEAGVAIETIYLDLLTPAARRLGELWEKDKCDFVDVTMGIWRLQEVMRDLSLRWPAKVDGTGMVRSAVFCPIPGDDHSFGAQMIEEVFARAGWQSDVLLKPKRRDLLDYLSNRPVDLVGITVSNSCPASALSSLVKAIRSVSMNPHTSIILGGRMINENPDVVLEVGADGTGSDAREALEIAEQLVAKAPVRAHALY
ncbi:MAG: cobalamin-dependent protein [Pseudomonadota bacterium]|nr:cobalamin-dependent protein [Pseudomonadota bacterium]